MSLSALLLHHFRTRYPDEMSCFWGPLRALRMIFPCFIGFRIMFLMVRCKDGGEVDVEGCGRLSVHDGFSDVAWFCVCKLVGGGSLAGRGDECKLGGGG